LDHLVGEAGIEDGVLDELGFLIQDYAVVNYLPMFALFKDAGLIRPSAIGG